MSPTRSAAHQIEPGVSTSHAGYVDYLRQCAGRWSVQPNGHEQALRVAATADRLEALSPAECDVCLGFDSEVKA